MFLDVFLKKFKSLCIQWIAFDDTTCKSGSCEEVCRLHRIIFKKLILAVADPVVADQPDLTNAIGAGCNSKLHFFFNRGLVYLFNGKKKRSISGVSSVPTRKLDVRSVPPPCRAQVCTKTALGTPPPAKQQTASLPCPGLYLVDPVGEVASVAPPRAPQKQRPAHPGRPKTAPIYPT
jgi:hypothetical protein